MDSKGRSYSPQDSFVSFVSFRFVFGKLGANCDSGITVMVFVDQGLNRGEMLGAPGRRVVYMN